MFVKNKKIYFFRIIEKYQIGFDISININSININYLIVIARNRTH